jgi:hypothetical protein
MQLEHAISPLPDGRDAVIYTRGAGRGFVLPEQHTISVTEEARTVYMATSDHGSGFVFERLEEGAGRAPCPA